MRGSSKAYAATPADRVDGDRLWARHMALARFGATVSGGVNRQALSDEEIAARAQLVAWGHEAGLTAHNDAIANLFLRLEGSDRQIAPVLAGSHIDSQPTGGKFDGAFGVLSALEAVVAIASFGERPKRSIEVVAWTNEEGSRFAPGMMGSEAFTGQRPLKVMLPIKDRNGISVRDAASRVLEMDEGVAPRELGFPVAAYIEPHIEQGPLLEREGLPIGIVTGIQGSRRFRVRVTGEAAHAGTTPRAERRDALLAAVRIIGKLDEAASDQQDQMCTVGLFQVEPNAPSVIPREAYFSVDLRHPDNAILARLAEFLKELCQSERGPCEVEVQEIAHAPSLDFPAQLRERMRNVAAALDLPCREIYSLAGHDARQLHYFCPTGMIFIPCCEGISHNEAESAEPEHLTAGTRVLANLLWELADDR